MWATRGIRGGVKDKRHRQQKTLVVRGISNDDGRRKEKRNFAKFSLLGIIKDKPANATNDTNNGQCLLYQKISLKTLTSKLYSNVLWKYLHLEWKKCYACGLYVQAFFFEAFGKKLLIIKNPNRS